MTGHALVRALNGSSCKQSPQLMKQDGNVTSSQLEADMRWQEHFAEAMAGHVVGAEQLVESYVACASGRAPDWRVTAPPKSNHHAMQSSVSHCRKVAYLRPLMSPLCRCILCHGAC